MGRGGSDSGACTVHKEETCKGLREWFVSISTTAAASLLTQALGTEQQSVLNAVGRCEHVPQQRN